jgi:hypothetical protein
VEQDKPDRAREKILPWARLAIHNLTDTVNWHNDIDFSRLAHALVCYGDRTNAEIAYAFTVPLHKTKQLLGFEQKATGGNPIEVGRSMPDASTEPDETSDARLCDGLCGRRSVYFKTLNVCEVCYQTSFCDECLPKLRDSTLGFRICNPTHPFLQIYPPRGLVRKGAEGYIVRIDDDKEMLVYDWIARIKKDWLG